MLLLGLLALVLFVAFHRLARGAVEQGQARLRAQAALQEAAWRCQALSPATRREVCRQQLRQVPRDNASLER